jgi:hypothetical protein
VAARFEAVMRERHEALFGGPGDGNRAGAVLDGRWPERTRRFWSVAAEVLEP